MRQSKLLLGMASLALAAGLLLCLRQAKVRADNTMRRADAIRYVGGKHPYLLITPSVVSDYSGFNSSATIRRERLSRRTPRGTVSLYCREDEMDVDPPNLEQTPMETKIAIVSPPGVPVLLELDDFPQAMHRGWLKVNSRNLSTYPPALVIPHNKRSWFDKKRIKLPGGFNIVTAYVPDPE